MKKILLALGNLYVETNYLGVETVGKDIFEIGHEYSAPKYEVRLGGSAVNFITQARRFNLEVGLIGKTGEDDSSKTLFQLLKNEGIRTDLIKQSGDVQTNVDTGLVVSHSAQNVQIVAGSANQSLSIEDIDLNNKIFDEVEAVYFGGCFKQKNLWPHYPEIFNKLSEKGIKLFIDPGRVPVDASQEWIEVLKQILPLSSGYFPNDKEILFVTGEDNVEAALKVISSWGAKLTAVKLGPDGCLVGHNDGEIKVSGYKVEAISTVGAGDVFNASFITKLLKNEALKTCAQFANASAAFRVSENKQGTFEDIEKFIKNN